MSDIAYSKYLRPEDMTRLMLISEVKRLKREIDERFMADHPIIYFTPRRQVKQAGAPDPRPTIRAGNNWDSV